MACLAYLPGLERLAAGCVIQRVKAEEAGCDFEGFIDAFLRRVDALDGAGPRLYLQAAHPSMEGALRNRGFKYQTEIGLLNDTPEEHDEIKVRLHPVTSDLDWTAKRALHSAGGTGLDGHENAPGLWADLEQRNSEAGGLELNLIKQGDDIVGALGLMAEKSILRLKNLVIHPDYRGSGFGAQAVHAGCAEAVRRGYPAVGAFALEQQGTLAFYESCGFRPIAAQTE